MSADADPIRTATCACGLLQVSVAGAPSMVYVCTCLDCQKMSGSVFTYGAWFPESAVRSIEGEHRRWRRGSDREGGWVESSFCPVCGARVFSQVQGFPGHIGVYVGCFADPAFAAPQTNYWSSRRHHWLELPRETAAIDRQ